MTETSANHINSAMREHGLSSRALEFQATYVSGAQIGHVADIVREPGLLIAGSRVKNSQDPENPAEISWHFGWKEQREYWDTCDERQKIEVSDEKRLRREIGLLAASFFVVHAQIQEVIDEPQPIIIPVLFKSKFPNFFGPHTSVLVRT